MIYKMDDKLTKENASALFKEKGFKIQRATEYADDGCSIVLKNSQDIYVGFIQDRGMEVSCRLGTEEYMNTYLEDVLFAVDIEYPNHKFDFLEMMQVCSKVIVDNYDKILKAFDKENIEESKRKMKISAKKRWDKWGDRFIKD